MLRACVLDLKGSWASHLPLVEFAYNIIIIQVLKQHLIKLCMGGGVDPQFVGMRWENEKSWGQRLFKGLAER